MAGAGGAEGYALKSGQIIPVADAVIPEIQVVKLDCHRPIVDESMWHIDLVKGPDDDWIDDAGYETFFNSNWKLQARSNRTGLRLEGPEPSFSDRATNRLPEHGEDPSNILDHDYPMGAINLAGQTPIILASDCPGAGGLVYPYAAPAAEFWKLAQSRPGNWLSRDLETGSVATWKLAQSRPGDIYRFREISVEGVQELRRRQDNFCTATSLTTR